MKQSAHIVVVTIGTVIGAAVITSGCSNGAQSGAPTIDVATDAEGAAADGTSAVLVTARVGEVPEGAVVTFGLSGIGLLSQSNAVVEQGQAAVSVWAPLEAELGTQASFTSTVTASVSVGGKVAEGSAPIVFEAPATGAPVLQVRADPDRVLAGGPDAITLVVDGRRLASDTVTLTADSDDVVVPANVTLVDGHAEIAIEPPASPAEVTVTVTSPGASAAQAALHFIADDAPAFDVNGDFAQISYSGMRISLFLLNPGTQCVVAPTYTLQHVVQTGAHVEMTTEICNIEMPGVNTLIGPSQTWVDPGFVDAANAQATNPLVIELDGTDLGATYSLGQSSFSPKTLGAELAHPDDDLPAHPDDPRVRDADDDGHPGVTIHNSVQGDQYTVNRTTTHTLDGTVESSDLIDGESTKTTESKIMNGSGITPEIHDLPVPFHMVRVDGRNGAVDIAARDGDPSSVSCADVMAYADELAAQFPAPDVSSSCN